VHGKWKPLFLGSSDMRPPPRAGAVVTAISSTIFITGGRTEHGISDPFVWAFDLSMRLCGFIANGHRNHSNNRSWWLVLIIFFNAERRGSFVERGWDEKWAFSISETIHEIWNGSYRNWWHRLDVGWPSKHSLTITLDKIFKNVSYNNNTIKFYDFLDNTWNQSHWILQRCCLFRYKEQNSLFEGFCPQNSRTFIYFVLKGEWLSEFWFGFIFCSYIKARRIYHSLCQTDASKISLYGGIGVDGASLGDHWIYDIGKQFENYIKQMLFYFILLLI
jgi:hypothetical protein